MDALLRFNCVIRIRRDDTIAQAVSLVIAQQTQAWISHFEPVRSPVYDFMAIRNAHRLIQDEDAQWNEYFSSLDITPIQITYEALTVSPDSAVHRIRSELGLGPATIVKHHEGPRRQASDVNEAWCSQYRKDLSERGL